MSTPIIPWFRNLYDEILQYRGDSLYAEVLYPWVEQGRLATIEFLRFKKYAQHKLVDDSELEAMWNLYALSRVNDLLLMSFQRTNGQSKIAVVTSEEYERFFSDIGFSVVETGRFTPFHHEIVKVHQSNEDDQPINVVGHFWPGLMLGEMLFSRSGVEVRGGRKHVVSQIAERSTLYFTYRRLNRKTNDLSMGWGSNSQWRTRMRQDYQVNGMRIFNAGGRNLLNAAPTSDEDPDGLTNNERMELCKHRCFVVTPKQDEDLFPFDDRLDEPFNG